MKTKGGREAVGAALGAVPSGLFVLVCEDDYAVVSWVQQAGFEPPAISVALKHERAVAGKVLAGKPFVLSVLPAGAVALSKPFLAGNAAGVQAALDEHGVMHGAVGYLRCRYRSHTSSGDHDVVVAEVTEGARLLPDQKPHVHQRRNGWQY